MSRKDWSEEHRHEEVCKIEDQIERLQARLDHLLSEEWRKPVRKEQDHYADNY